MHEVEPVKNKDAAPAWRQVWQSLPAGSLGVTLTFAVIGAVVLSPIFAVTFLALLARTLFVSLLLWLAFVLAQRLPEALLPRWMPRWLLTTVAVALTAPLATFLVYVIVVGGRLSDFTGSTARLTGFASISAMALLLGLLITLTALLREREARARALALEVELQRSRVDKHAADARLALLQGQIEPHFLFNTLANVQALVEAGSAQAAPVLRSLIEYLRATMPKLHQDRPTLGDELALVRAYLELMRMRLPDRLQYRVQVDAALHAQPIPPMSLLTLVENAVRHGIDPAEDGGTIDVGADRTGGVTRVWVADSGAGLSENAVPGTGLSNLRARLAAFFGSGAALELHEVTPHGLRAEIVIRG